MAVKTMFHHYESNSMVVTPRRKIGPETGQAAFAGRVSLERQQVRSCRPYLASSLKWPGAHTRSLTRTRSIQMNQNSS
jgi:hypothetical protein